MHAGRALVARGEHDCVDAGDVGEVGELAESEYEEGGEMKLGSSATLFLNLVRNSFIGCVSAPRATNSAHAVPATWVECIPNVCERN